MRSTRILMFVPLVAILSLIVVIFLKRTPAPVLPILQKLPDFELTESRGMWFRSSDLKNAPWIANFIFTSCGGQCPLIVEATKKLDDEMPDRFNYKIVSITVDPVRDTPTVLEAYRAKKHLNDKWFLLTGKPEKIAEIIQKNFLLAQEAKSIDQISHSSKLVLVDGDLQIRGYYDSTDPQEMKKLERDLKSLVK